MMNYKESEREMENYIFFFKTHQPITKYRCYLNHHSNF